MEILWRIALVLAVNMLIGAGVLFTLIMVLYIISYKVFNLFKRKCGDTNDEKNKSRTL